MKAKILEVVYGKEWGTGLNKLHYYNVKLEGQGDKFWNIGVKKQNPDFLQVGKTLEYDIKEEGKQNIKRVNNRLENKTVAGGGSKKTAEAVNPASTSFIRNLDNYDEKNLIFIDIETVRAVKDLTPGTPLHDAWSYKARYNNELERKSGQEVTVEQYFAEKAALYAPFAKVVTIVVGRIVDEKLSVKRYAVSKETKWSEAVLLKEFNDDINLILSKNPDAVFVGWANHGFDQPFLNKRMLANRIQPNMLLDTNHLKPWEISGFDLKTQWQGSGFYPDSMISVAVALGLPSPKVKMEGSEVGEYYFAGKITDIVEYCVGDVLTAANIYRIFVNRPIVELK